MLINPAFPPALSAVCSVTRMFLKAFPNNPTKHILFILSFPSSPEVILLVFIRCKRALEREQHLSALKDFCAHAGLKAAVIRLETREWQRRAW